MTPDAPAFASDLRVFYAVGLVAAAVHDGFVPKQATSSIRFLNDGSLRTGEGWHLVSGSPLSRDAAREAARGMRIVIHNFGKPAEDITGDTRRIVPALDEVTEHYELFKYNAFIYSGDGEHKVLVLRWNH